MSWPNPFPRKRPMIFSHKTSEMGGADNFSANLRSLPVMWEYILWLFFQLHQKDKFPIDSVQVFPYGDFSDQRIPMWTIKHNTAEAEFFKISSCVQLSRNYRRSSFHIFLSWIRIARAHTHWHTWASVFVFVTVSWGVWSNG